ncbi:MAG TPA: Rieske (2Fe-2S) protein [Egibacteraceae bacterium]|jgi:nitrite reductase/ring-hydroxylating ferredoxin subunit|nr:Rieske (2Fe-2S) protein [Egibacteraceae bacterium]
MVASTRRVVRVATVADLPPRHLHTLTVQDRSVVVVNLGGAFVAFDGSCTHAGGPLGEGRVVDGEHLRCPWHGARFVLRTGAPCDAGPARKPLRLYPVHVDGDDVLVTLG